MTDARREIKLDDAAATEALGAALARAYSKTLQGSLTIYLSGELGAGKTTCARSLLRALGVLGPIRSPTYTLVEVYPLATVTCVHVDLYRLQQAAEIDELGLRDEVGGPCLLLIEWPEKGAGVLPSADVELSLSYCGDCRLGSLRGVTGRGGELLAALAQPAPA